MREKRGEVLPQQGRDGHEGVEAGRVGTRPITQHEAEGVKIPGGHSFQHTQVLQHQMLSSDHALHQAQRWWHIELLEQPANSLQFKGCLFPPQLEHLVNDLELQLVVMGQFALRLLQREQLWDAQVLLVGTFTWKVFGLARGYVFYHWIHAPSTVGLVGNDFVSLYNKHIIERTPCVGINVLRLSKFIGTTAKVARNGKPTDFMEFVREPPQGLRR